MIETPAALGAPCTKTVKILRKQLISFLGVGQAEATKAAVPGQNTLIGYTSCAHRDGLST